MYAAFSDAFNAKLNKNVPGNVSRSHAIDGSKYSLFVTVDLFTRLDFQFLWA